MDAEFIEFGRIKVAGREHDSDVIIEGGEVGERKKKPSKQYKAQFGHTPLSVDERIPWGGDRLIVGTGAYGKLPIMDEVLAEAKRRGVEVIARPTPEACRLLHDLTDWDVNAILHVTC